MATLPRSTKSPSSSAFHTPGRPVSEFDAGINTSTAWTEHLELASDEEAGAIDVEDDDEGTHRPARALYAFEGKPEFRELSVAAGDELEVVKEELADGWSLVKSADGEIGLLPRSYYTFTADFAASPDLGLPPSTTSRFSSKQHREASSSTITPRDTHEPAPAQPIVPQHTGDWTFPSFRQSLLGGKSLNRFSSFVTSGAEEFVLKGSSAEKDEAKELANGHGHGREESSASTTSSSSDGDDADENALKRQSAVYVGKGDADRHFVDASHAWKEKIPPFRVLVHSPSKRTSSLSGAFTVYNVTSFFHAPEADDEDGRPASPTRLTVQRRFSHFVTLHTALMRRLPGIALPPLPEKQYAGRFSEDFVEARRGDLERYINRVVRHPVARYAEVVTFFLSCESDAEWKRLLPRHLALPPAGPAFYARVFHPAFNLDLEDAEDAIGRFVAHARAVGKGVQGLRSIFTQVRQARIGMSNSERLLSYSLLSLITGKTMTEAPTTGTVEEDEEYSAKDRGVVNEDGAWCWREGCDECLKMTKAIQKTAESLQNVADLYDDHARRTQLATHEFLKGVAHPSSIYKGVVNTHQSTISRYRDAMISERADEDVAGRCETVLNTTMAELDTYHTQKREDFTELAKDHLDGEIAFYEQVLQRLRTARAQFDRPRIDELGRESGPRQPSMYERELERPRPSAPPLMQPCPHVFDSAPMRPVSVAIQEGVGMLLGTPSATRGSVFGRLWG